MCAGPCLVCLCTFDKPAVGLPGGRIGDTEAPYWVLSRSLPSCHRPVLVTTPIWMLLSNSFGWSGRKGVAGHSSEAFLLPCRALRRGSQLLGLGLTLPVLTPARLQVYLGQKRAEGSLLFSTSSSCSSGFSSSIRLLSF